MTSPRAFKGYFVDHLLPALGVGSVFINEQCAILIADKKPRGNGVNNADFVAIFDRHLSAHPFGKIIDRGLGVRF